MKGRDIAGVVAPPPLIFFIPLALGLLLDAREPWAWPWPGELTTRAAAVVFGAIAIGIAGWQVATFGRAGTPISVAQPTRALVTDGPYRFSRNPIYLALALLYLALAFAFGRWWTVALLVPALAVIRYGVISREEAYLQRKFGDAYREYSGHVRRWL